MIGRADQSQVKLKYKLVLWCEALYLFENVLPAEGSVQGVCHPDVGEGYIFENLVGLQSVPGSFAPATVAICMQLANFGLKSEIGSRRMR